MRVHLRHPRTLTWCGSIIYKNQGATHQLREANCAHCLRVFDLDMSTDAHTAVEICQTSPTVTSTTNQ